MTPHDYVTLLGGLFWLVILMTRQQLAFRAVIRSQGTHDDDDQKANP